MQALLGAILTCATNSRYCLTNRHQDELMRWVFCGVEKTRKISQSLIVLYPQLTLNPELEFSIGILLRSLIMDTILTLKAKSIVQKSNGTNFDAIKEELLAYCLQVINDGTANFITDIYDSSRLTDEQKKEYAENFIKPFAELFSSNSTGKPALHNENKINLLKILRECKNNNITPCAVRDLYSFYSKYDHLSHWTGLSNHIPDDHKEGKMKLGILLAALNLRDILSILQGFDNTIIGLDSHIERLHNTIMTYPPETFINSE